MQISNINNKDLACLINDNYNNFLDGNSHDFMADKLILTMVQILNEIKSTIFLPAQVHQAEDSGNSPMYQPYIYSPYGPSSTIVSWNWQNYFTYLCYIGLQTTTEFHILFPIPSSEYRFYSNYIARGDLIFNP